jgi:hypothetical protein
MSLPVGSQARSELENATYHPEISSKVTLCQTRAQELAFAPKKRKLALVTQRLLAPTCKVGPGTIAAALAALSMAVLGHFFI